LWKLELAEVRNDSVLVPLVEVAEATYLEEEPKSGARNFNIVYKTIIPANTPREYTIILNTTNIGGSAPI